MNPYDVLGVSAGASDDDVAKAYKKLAKRYHPDLNPGNDAAARKMGEINRAYDDIKNLRQNGTAQNYDRSAYSRAYNPGFNAGAAYGNPFDPFNTSRQTTYTYSYRRVRRNPVGVVLAVMVTFFIVRFLLSVMFGGFGGSYYVNGQSQNTYGGYVPGYGYYQTEP